MRPGIALTLIGLGALACACLASCGSSESAPEGEPPLTSLKLVQNPWLGSQIDAEIVALLLREQLGFTVTIVPMNETEQWDSIASGEAHASLEVWPSGHAKELETHVKTGKVENVGLLGPVGRIGWYVPSYVIEDHPELTSWESLKDGKIAGIFKTPQTSPKGRFLGGDESFTQYDGQIIHNLGLELSVVFAGSEEALLGELEAAYPKRAPLLFYFWTPHWAHAKYALTKLDLPQHTDACYAKAASGGVDCDYPPDYLFKIAWPALRTRAPRAYKLIAAFTFSTKAQIELLGAVQTGQKTPSDAARAWVDQNEATWREWVR